MYDAKQQGRSGSGRVWPSQLLGRNRSSERGTRRNSDTGNLLAEAIANYRSFSNDSGSVSVENVGSENGRIVEPEPVRVGIDLSKWHHDDGGGICSDTRSDVVGDSRSRSFRVTKLGKSRSRSTSAVREQPRKLHGNLSQSTVAEDEIPAGAERKGATGDVFGIENFFKFINVIDGQSDGTDKVGAEAKEQIVRYVPVTLAEYAPVQMSSSELLAIPVEDLHWIVGEYYFLLATMHAARCTLTLGEANDIKTRLISVEYKDALYVQYGMMYPDQPYKDLQHLLRSMTTESNVVKFVWQHFQLTNPRKVAQDTALTCYTSSLMLDGFKRMAIWQNKTVLQFDYKFGMVVVHAIPRQYVLVYEKQVLNVEHFETLVRHLYGIVSETTKSHAKFFLNYVGDLRNLVIGVVGTSLKQLRKGLTLTVLKPGKGLCTVCNYEVVLDGHEQRCRVDTYDKLSTDDWIGDALLALDMRLLIIVYDVPAAERGVHFQRFTSNQALALYLKKFHGDEYADGTESVASAFEAKYQSVYRHEYVQYIVKLLEQQFTKKQYNEIGGTNQILLTALGLIMHLYND